MSNKLEKYLHKARVEIYGEEANASSLVQDLHEKLVESVVDHFKEVAAHIKSITESELNKIEKKYSEETRREVLSKLSDMTSEMSEHKHATIESKILADCLRD